MPTFRSDVIGSLLRPPYLKEARSKRATNELTEAEFKAIEDRSVDEAIELQANAGLDVLTDGEMRRYAFFGHLIDAVEGYDKFGGWAIPFRDEQGHERAHHQADDLAGQRHRPDGQLRERDQDWIPRRPEEGC